MDEWRDLKNIAKALADTARLTIVYHLVQHEEITVTALTELLGLSQPLVSTGSRRITIPFAAAMLITSAARWKYGASSVC